MKRGDKLCDVKRKIDIFRKVCECTANKPPEQIAQPTEREGVTKKSANQSWIVVDLLSLQSKDDTNKFLRQMCKCNSMRLSLSTLFGIVLSERHIMHDQ